MIRKTPHTAFFVVGVLATLVGCIGPGIRLSLFPLHSDETVVFRPELLGTWITGSERMIFEKGLEEDYVVTYRLDDTPVIAPAKARLVHLGQHHFLNVYPENEGNSDPDGGLYFPFIPLHLLYSLELNGDVLKLGWFSDDWLQKRIESGEMDLTYTSHPDFGVLLTASTEALQRFFLEHAEDDNALEWWVVEREK